MLHGKVDAAFKGVLLGELPGDNPGSSGAGFDLTGIEGVVGALYSVVQSDIVIQEMVKIIFDVEILNPAVPFEAYEIEG